MTDILTVSKHDDDTITLSSSATLSELFGIVNKIVTSIAEATDGELNYNDVLLGLVEVDDKDNVKTLLEFIDSFIDYKSTVDSDN